MSSEDREICQTEITKSHDDSDEITKCFSLTESGDAGYPMEDAIRYR